MDEFSTIWERIKHENDLVNHRLTWLGTFQGLLLAALAFAWDKHDAKYMIYALGALGVSVALSIAVATYRANKALDRLSRYWDKVKPKDYVGSAAEGARSRSGFSRWLPPGPFSPLTFPVTRIRIRWLHRSR